MLIRGRLAFDARFEPYPRFPRNPRLAFLPKPVEKDALVRVIHMALEPVKSKIISRIAMTSLQSSVAPRTSRSDDWFRGLRDGHNI